MLFGDAMRRSALLAIAGCLLGGCLSKIDGGDSGNDVTDVPLDVCVPDCTGRMCGDNGCGGQCGACAMGSQCNVSTGQCFACVPGEVCPAAECTVGSIDCTGGTRQCVVTSNAVAGSPCTGGVCDGQGMCVACSAGTACSPAKP